MNWQGIEGTRQIISDRADLHKIMYHIQRLASESATHPKVIEISKRLATSSEPVKAVFDYAYDTILYVPDLEGVQELRYAHNSIREGVGNCTDYSILISALLQNLGIAHKFRVVSYSRPSQKEHIYVVANDKVLDAVLLQDQTGKETRAKRPSKGAYNVELPYTAKFDYNMRTPLHILGSTKGSVKLPVASAEGSRSEQLTPSSKCYVSPAQCRKSKQLIPSPLNQCYVSPYQFSMCGGQPIGILTTPKKKESDCGCGCDGAGSCNDVHINSDSRRNRARLLDALRQRKNIIYKGHKMGNVGKMLGSIGQGGDYWNEDGDYNWDEAFSDGNGQGGTGGGGGGGMNINWQQAGNITSGILNLFNNCKTMCNISHPFNKEKRNKCKCSCAVEKNIPVTVDCCRYGVTAPGQNCTSSPASSTGSTNMLIPALAIVGLATIV